MNIITNIDVKACFAARQLRSRPLFAFVSSISARVEW